MTERAYGTSAFFLAALVAGAGVIHFAMVPTHAAESLVDGIGFAVVGWLQITLAIAIAVRPNKRVLVATVAVSAAALGLWVLSRTVGLPVGSHEGVVEEVGSIDLLSAVFEGLAILGSVYLLARRPESYSFRFRPAMLGVVALPAVLVMAASTAVVASPDAMGHDESGGHHGQAASAGTADHHATGSGEDHAEGGAGHGHSGVAPWQNITDDETRDLLGEQLAAARDAAELYPTAQDAADAGYVRVTPYVPLIGAHWMNFGLVDDEFDPSKPEMLLYDESGLDADIVGLSYYFASGEEGDDDAPLPEGFAGPNDQWHAHLGLCIGSAGVIGPESLTEEECNEIGGTKADGGGRYMVHAWVVPGWESPWGIFSGEHPDLT